MKLQSITDRYISQKLFFKDIEEKIHNSKVLVVGIGGIGSWISEFLARIGVKEIKIIDKDIVELKNLHRQDYTEKDIGKGKIDAMEERIKEINSEINVIKYNEIKLKAFDGVDIFFDGTDNIETKYLLNEISVIKNIPYIFGSIVEDHGFFGLINPNDFCLYDLYKGRKNVITSNAYGIDPSSVLFLSSLMINLFIDYLRGKREGRIYHFNLSKKVIEEIKVKRNNCKICVRKEFEYINGRNI